MLLTSHRSPQPVRRTSSPRNSGSGHGVGEAQVTGWILDEETTLQDLLRVPHMLHDDVQGLLRIRQGEEMIEIDTACHTPGEVLRHERRFEPGKQRFQARQMTGVERRSAPE